jgi:hypothetical protein
MILTLLIRRLRAAVTRGDPGMSWRCPRPSSCHGHLREPAGRRGWALAKLVGHPSSRFRRGNIAMRQ